MSVDQSHRLHIEQSGHSHQVQDRCSDILQSSRGSHWYISPRVSNPFKLLNFCKGWCLEGEKILSICERGDKFLGEEVAKVYKGKKISKGKSKCYGH